MTRRVCFYHAGCPDGFGAAWTLSRVWRGEGEFIARGHDDRADARRFEDALLVFADIAPANDELRSLCEHAAQVIVLDHHVTARDRFESDLELANAVAAEGHEVHFDLTHSGAMLTWLSFAGDQEPPDLLRYVEDQDLWNWKLPASQEVNAAIDSYPHDFEVWSELATRKVSELAAEGAPILRANAMAVERSLRQAKPLRVGGRRVEAVNASQNRSSLGHELARRAAFGAPWGCVYRLEGDRVRASLYSIGDFDVAAIAASYGGGGHHNAAGFSVSLRRWLDDFVV